MEFKICKKCKSQRKIYIIFYKLEFYFVWSIHVNVFLSVFVCMWRANNHSGVLVAHPRASNTNYFWLFYFCFFLKFTYLVLVGWRMIVHLFPNHMSCSWPDEEFLYPSFLLHQSIYFMSMLILHFVNC